MVKIIDIKEEYKKRIFEQAEFLIETYGKLDILYLRVSTKNKGQEETDQLTPILEFYKLKEEECLVIEAKESAYQIKKQKNRILNFIPELSKMYPEYDKVLYLWDLDRLYRNQDMQVDFIRENHKLNLMVFSLRQNFLNEIRKVPGGMGKAMYNFMVEILGWKAEQESKDKADRLLKSLKVKDGRYYTNKNRLYGRKLRDIKGKKLNLTGKQLDKIETHIIKCINAEWTYKKIINFFETKNIHISSGYISNMKKKHLK